MTHKRRLQVPSKKYPVVVAVRLTPTLSKAKALHPLLRRAALKAAEGDPKRVVVVSRTQVVVRNNPVRPSKLVAKRSKS